MSDNFSPRRQSRLFGIVVGLLFFVLSLFVVALYRL